MIDVRAMGSFFGKGARLSGKLLRIRSIALVLLIVLILILTQGGGLAVRGSQETRVDRVQTDPIPASEFSRIIRDFSDQEGLFFSDNFISNETGYLHIVGKLRELRASGGAYIGVGPELNFTYIAKVRPRIAFIVDIRRQALIQYLLFKAIFHLSENRAQFLSRLFSKPLEGPDAPGRGASLDALLSYFNQAPATEEAFTANRKSILRTIEQDFQFSLSRRDHSSLAYVYSVFWQENLRSMFRIGGRDFRSFWRGRFPTLRDLMLATDLEGEPGHFLASEDDYGFLRTCTGETELFPWWEISPGPKRSRPWQPTCGKMDMP